MHLRPLQDRIVVKRIETRHSTVGGSSSRTAPQKSRTKERSSWYPEGSAERTGASARWM
jgi:co-chaperonin GroES (HSP10)